MLQLRAVMQKAEIKHYNEVFSFIWECNKNSLS